MWKEVKSRIPPVDKSTSFLRQYLNGIEIEYQSQSISDYLAANDESLQEITRAYVDPEELTENPNDPKAYVEDSMTDVTLAVIDNNDGHIIYEGDTDEIIKYLKEKVAGKTEEDK